MKRIVVGAAALAGVLLVIVGALVGVAVGAGRTSSPAVWIVGPLLGLAALSGALWKIRGSLDAESERPVPWASEAFATPAPERTPDEYPLSSDFLARRIDEAARTARSEGTVADGVAVVRPALREALIEAMVAGGRDRTAAERALATGEWTDDPVAASVLEADVAPPAMSMRRRIEAWLFPERVLRSRVRTAVHAVATVAEASLPTVPGQTAPRTVPVRKPRLEELRRGAAGDIQGALDPDAVARGPDPPAPPDPDGPDGPDGGGTDA